MDAEFLVQALFLLSLALWMTTRAFRFGAVADRRILMAAYIVLALALAFAIGMTLIHVWG
jgi:hypothetical protein